ncbi:MAG TPA: molybdopterin-dependent oxidoreductase [Aggregatilinea sp.]|nr:molybdopterin-dependent oxidoreductase [Aggregatilinea sp.]HML20550.1 molybdopterin-dependent oxidoreductase [Aggregatilinea sp.]
MSTNSFLAKTMSDVLLNRRSFLKWSSALSSTAVLSGGLHNISENMPLTPAAKAAESAGEWVTAACWHNCGGQRCVIKAHVVDGVVKKVKTDDTHDDSTEQPQIRGCARGRSQQQQCFGADRLKYPMKRKNWEPGGGKKELRGQDEWVRISWDEALDYIAGEFKRIIEQYGNEGILETGSTLGSLITMLGGADKLWGSTSWGTWLYTGPIIGLGDGLSLTSHNDRLEMQNSDLVVMWGGNSAWSSQGNNMHYYIEAKKAGVKFICIDPYYNDTHMILADEWIPIRPATDHALALGIAYTLLDEDDPENGPLIDWDFLDRCTVGFDADHMPEDADPKKNFKDYVLGTYDDTPKTPEWASEICGVAPYKIRQLARTIGSTPKVSLLTAWSVARVNNADTWPQMFMTLGAMTGNIGKPGCCTGVSCWERTADGGPFLISAGGSGAPRASNDNAISVSINNNEAWSAVLDGKYVAGYDDVRDINIQMIVHDSGHALNQKVGMTKGIEAHRKVEFVLSLNLFLNTNSKYADIVLPITTQWERYGFLKGNRDHLIWARQVTEPLFEAKDDDWVARELATRLDVDPDVVDPMPLKQQVFNQLAGATVIKDNGVDFEPLLTISADDIAAMEVEGEPQEGRITLAEFKENGVYTVSRKKGDKLGYIAHQAFRDDPEANPLKSATGKLEIYSEANAEMVKGHGFNEIDAIPTYMDPIEGYKDTFEDWDNKVKGEYPLQMFTIHYRRRSHSIFDNIPWLREAFPQELIMNPVDAEPLGLKHGDTALVTSRHGKVIRPVFLTERIMPGVVSLGEGAWAEVEEDTGIDKAGATNTLNGAIPTGQGHQGWNSLNVKIERYGGPDARERDYKWSQRIPIKEA